MLRKIKFGMFAMLAACSLFALGATQEAKADHPRPHSGPSHGWNHGYRYGYHRPFYPVVYPGYPAFSPAPIYPAPIYPAPIYVYRPVGHYRH